MPLHLTKIAYSAKSPESLRTWLESHDSEARLTTRYLPRRHEEMRGGSLYWIFEHTLIGRSPLIGFQQRDDDARWWIRLEPRLTAVHPQPRRAHQGWRYLAEADAPPDVTLGDEDTVLPPALVSDLAKLGLA